MPAFRGHTAKQQPRCTLWRSVVKCWIYRTVTVDGCHLRQPNQSFGVSTPLSPSHSPFSPCQWLHFKLSHLLVEQNHSRFPSEFTSQSPSIIALPPPIHSPPPHLSAWLLRPPLHHLAVQRIKLPAERGLMIWAGSLPRALAQDQSSDPGRPVPRLARLRVALELPCSLGSSWRRED